MSTRRASRGPSERQALSRSCCSTSSIISTEFSRLTARSIKTACVRGKSGSARDSTLPLERFHNTDPFLGEDLEPEADGVGDVSVIDVRVVQLEHVEIDCGVVGPVLNGEDAALRAAHSSRSTIPPDLEAIALARCRE